MESPTTVFLALQTTRTLVYEESKLPARHGYLLFGVQTASDFSLPSNLPWRLGPSTPPELHLYPGHRDLPEGDIVYGAGARARARGGAVVTSMVHWPGLHIACHGVFAKTTLVNKSVAAGGSIKFQFRKPETSISLSRPGRRHHWKLSWGLGSALARLSLLSFDALVFSRQFRRYAFLTPLSRYLPPGGRRAGDCCCDNLQEGESAIPRSGGARA